MNLDGVTAWWQGLPSYAQVGIPVAGVGIVAFIALHKGGQLGTQVVGPFGTSSGSGATGPVPTTPPKTPDNPNPSPPITSPGQDPTTPTYPGPYQYGTPGPSVPPIFTLPAGQTGGVYGGTASASGAPFTLDATGHVPQSEIDALNAAYNSAPPWVRAMGSTLGRVNGGGPALTPITTINNAGQVNVADPSGYAPPSIAQQIAYNPAYALTPAQQAQALAVQQYNSDLITPPNVNAYTIATGEAFMNPSYAATHTAPSNGYRPGMGGRGPVAIANPIPYGPVLNM